jgi:hypothetical protein
VLVMPRQTKPAMRTCLSLYSSQGRQTAEVDGTRNDASDIFRIVSDVCIAPVVMDHLSSTHDQSLAFPCFHLERIGLLSTATCTYRSLMRP